MGQMPMWVHRPNPVHARLGPGPAFHMVVMGSGPSALPAPPEHLGLGPVPLPISSRDPAWAKLPIFQIGPYHAIPTFLHSVLGQDAPHVQEPSTLLTLSCAWKIQPCCQSPACA